MSPDMLRSPDFSVLTVVVNCGQAGRAMKIARSSGITGGTVIPVKGFCGGPILRALDLCERNMEAVIMLSERNTIKEAIRNLDEVFAFAKPHRGFAFCVPVVSAYGMHSHLDACSGETERMNNMKYRAIFTIVDRGNGESVIDSAKTAGAKGGTIFSGRGSGIHETEKLFSMEIEPEKEIVLIISDEDTATYIVEAIRRDMKIDEPGKGIVYVQPVSDIVGVVGLE